MEEGKTYQSTDDELGALLHRLIVVEGHEEVEIQHPTEGLMVVTRDSYKTMMESLDKAAKMSPADRLEETKRLERKRQMQFRTALIDAKVYTVDIDDEDNFGFDINGDKIDMDGLIFTPTNTYPKGSKVILNEIGAFVDEMMIKPPIRILTKPLADNSE